VAAPPPVASAGTDAPAAANGTPHPSADTPSNGSQTPFTPPDAWNVDALTAPPPEPTGEAPQIGSVDRAVTAELQPKVVEVVKTVFDPEIPVDIYELGLIYDVFVTAEGVVAIKMTLTAPGCPAAQILPGQVGAAAKTVDGITDAKVDVVWEPGWTKDRMSDVAKLQLGMW